MKKSRRKKISEGVCIAFVTKKGHFKRSGPFFVNLVDNVNKIYV